MKYLYIVLEWLSLIMNGITTKNILLKQIIVITITSYKQPQFVNKKLDRI